MADLDTYNGRFPEDSLAARIDQDFDGHKFLVFLVQFGPPVVVLIVIFAIVSSRTRFFIHPLPRVVATVGGCFVKSASTYTCKRVVVATSLQTAVVLTPVACLAFCVALAAMIPPSFVGISAALLGGSMGLAVLGMFMWRQRAWRVTGPPGSYVSATHGVLQLAGILLLGFEGYMLAINPHSFVATSWVHLSANMVPMAAVAHLSTLSSHHLTVRQAVQLVDMFRDSMHPPSPEVLFEAAKFDQIQKRRNRTIQWLYLTALSILGVYSLVNFARSDDSESDEGRFLSFATSAAVVILDLCNFTLLHNGAVFTHSASFCGVMAASRAGLVAFGAKYWFLGQCTVFLVYGVVLSTVISARVVASSGRFHLRSVLLDPVILVLGFLTLCFSGLIIMLGVWQPDGVPLPKVRMFSSDLELWHFGVASIFLVTMWCSGAFAYRFAVMGKRKITHPSVLAAVITEAVSTAGGILVYRASGSITLLALSLFSLPAVAAASLAYAAWVDNDFIVFARSRRARMHPHYTPASSADAGDGVPPSPPSPPSPADGARSKSSINSVGSSSLPNGAPSTKHSSSSPPSASGPHTGSGPGSGSDPGSDPGSGSGSGSDSSMPSSSTFPPPASSTSDGSSTSGGRAGREPASLSQRSGSPSAVEGAGVFLSMDTRAAKVAPPPLLSLPSARVPAAASPHQHHLPRGQVSVDNPIPLVGGRESERNGEAPSGACAPERKQHHWYAPNLRPPKSWRGRIRLQCVALWSDWHNTITIISGAISYLACVLGFGYMLSRSLPHMTVWPVCGAVLLVTVTVVGAVSWFNTLRASCTVITSVVLSCALHAFMHLALYNDPPGVGRPAIVLSFSLYPAVAIMATGLYKWADDHWRISRVVVWCMILSQATIFGTIIYSFFVRPRLGAVLLVIYAYLVLLAAILVRWVSQRFYITGWWKAAAIAAVGGGISLALLMCLSMYINADPTPAVVYLSVCYLLGGSSLAVWSTSLVQEMLRGQVYFSAALFPVYRFRVAQNTLVPANEAFLLGFAAIAAFAAWGIALVILVHPFYVGLIILCIAQTLGVVVAVYFISSTTHKFDSAIEMLSVEGGGSLFEALDHAVQVAKVELMGTKSLSKMPGVLTNASKGSLAASLRQSVLDRLQGMDVNRFVGTSPSGPRSGAGRLRGGDAGRGRLRLASSPRPSSSSFAFMTAARGKPGSRRSTEALPSSSSLSRGSGAPVTGVDVEVKAASQAGAGGGAGGRTAEVADPAANHRPDGGALIVSPRGDEGSNPPEVSSDRFRAQQDSAAASAVTTSTVVVDVREPIYDQVFHADALLEEVLRIRQRSSSGSNPPKPTVSDNRLWALRSKVPRPQNGGPDAAPSDTEVHPPATLPVVGPAAQSCQHVVGTRSPLHAVTVSRAHLDTLTAGSPRHMALPTCQQPGAIPCSMAPDSAPRSAPSSQAIHFAHPRSSRGGGRGRSGRAGRGGVAVRTPLGSSVDVELPGFRGRPVTRKSSSSGSASGGRPGIGNSSRNRHGNGDGNCNGNGNVNGNCNVNGNGNGNGTGTGTGTGPSIGTGAAPGPSSSRLTELSPPASAFHGPNFSGTRHAFETPTALLDTEAGRFYQESLRLLDIQSQVVESYELEAKFEAHVVHVTHQRAVRSNLAQRASWEEFLQWCTFSWNQRMLEDAGLELFARSLKTGGRIEEAVVKGWPEHERSALHRLRHELQRRQDRQLQAERHREKDDELASMARMSMHAPEPANFMPPSTPDPAPLLSASGSIRSITIHDGASVLFPRVAQDTNGVAPGTTTSPPTVAPAGTTNANQPNHPPRAIPDTPDYTSAEGRAGLSKLDRDVMELVQDIEVSCASSGTPYNDPDFPPNNSSLWLDPQTPLFENYVEGWQRTSTLYPHASVCSQQPDPREIRQGILGNCWYLSALSVVASRPHLLNRLLITKRSSGWGVYAVKLFKHGRWIPIILDDMVPVTRRQGAPNGNGASKQEAPSRWRHGTLKPAFACSHSGKELWPLLLEKALAKYYGSYGALQGGLVHLGLADLTGGAASYIKLRDAAIQLDIESGALWTRLLSYFKAGHLLGAGTPPVGDALVSEFGIVNGHAYAMLQVREEADHHGVHRLIQLQNPWGTAEWNGAWGNKDTARWSQRMKARLERSDSSDRRRTGLFWMAYEDFVRHFSTVYVCRLFQLAPEGVWYKSTASGEWKGISAGGIPNGPLSPGSHNPQFLIKVSRPCTAFISLVQEEVRGRPLHHIAFFVVAHGGARVSTLKRSEIVASSGKFINSREVTAEVELQGDTQPYTLVGCTYSHGSEARFRYTVHTTHPLLDTGPGSQLQPVPAATSS